MTGYRRIYRCPECKKMGARKTDMTNGVFACFACLCGDNVVLCKHCGKIVKLERVAAKLIVRDYGEVIKKLEEE